MKNSLTTLRTIEPADLDFLLSIENNQKNWLISQTRIPFSKQILMDYIQSAQDIYLTKQIRFIIELNDLNLPIGTLDLYEYDPFNERVGVGIIIDEAYRKKGYASDALEIALDYCFNTLLLENVFCQVLTSNQASINLFEKFRFQKIGVRKNWYKTKDGWQHEILYQLNKS